MRAVLYLFLVLAACGIPDGDPPRSPDPDEAPVSIPVSSSAVDTPYFQLGAQGGATRQYHQAPILDWADTTARRAQMAAFRESARRSVVLSNRITGADDWRDADAAVQRSVGPDSLVPHNVALLMLDHHLLRGDLEPDKAEVLGRYVDALLTHGTTEGAVMLWALRRLDGTWDAAKIRRAAQASADRMGGPFAKIAGCIGCTVDEALAGMWPQRRRASEHLLRDMEIVHRALLALADDGTPMPNAP